MRHAFEQRDRILPGQIRVAGIEIHPEVGMLHGIHEAAEHIHLLRELRILPKIVLVMVFQNEGDSALLGIRQAGVNGLRREPHAVIDRDFRATLTAEHAAIGAAQRKRHVDPAPLFGNLPRAKSGVGMREVGGAAHHRNHLALVLDHLSKDRPVPFIGHFQEAGIPLSP